jgi:RAB protein geranylgeranyltransferase component A
MKADAPPEEAPIEPTDWDLIVLGTGLAECVVARCVGWWRRGLH